MIAFRPRLLSCLLAILGIFLGAMPSKAHKVSAVSVVAEFETGERSYKVELAMDVDPTGDPALDDQIPPEEAARSFATEAIRIYFDDETVSPEPEIKLLTESDEDTPVELQRKKVIGTLRGTYPEDAEHFLLRVMESTEAAVVMVTIKDGKAARRLQVLYPGEFSNPQELAPATEDPSPPGSGSPTEATELQDESREKKNSNEVGSGRWWWRGFRAVLPSGVDFWAFMLAMFALTLRSRPLGIQLALYTVAHSLALALATFRLVSLPDGLVAPLAALGALVLAVDNLVSRELRPWRGVAIFGFGLIHGLALADLLWKGNPRISELLPALIGFNVGVECAQFLLLALVSLVALGLSQKKWFRPGIVQPLSVILAGIAVFRVIEVLWLQG